MPYVTSVERIGFKRGVLEGEKRGEKRGKQEGLVSLLARQIAKRFKSQISKESPLLKQLGVNDLAKLGEKLFDFETLDEVHEWIENRLKQKIKI